MVRTARHFPIISIALVVSWSSATTRHAACAPDHQPSATPTVVLVLRNGNLLAGAIRRAGNYYQVETANAILQVPESQVELACGSVDEAYQSRRQSRGGSTADSHLELARWCLRNSLPEFAERELADVRTLDAEHPTLPAVERQLRQLLEAQQLRRTRASKSGPEPPNSRVQAAPGAVALSFSLTADAQSHFVRSIQPMLIHNCATGGCHQVGSLQRMQLDRWALEGNGNAVLVRKNLHSILEQMSKEDPVASPLMTWARTVHGGAESSSSTPLEPHQSAMLLDWMNKAAGIKPILATEGGGGANDAEASAVDGNDVASNASTAPPRSTRPVATSETSLSKRQPDDAFEPRDEFDPEIFNRRQQATANRLAARPDKPIASGEDATEPVTEASQE